MLQIADVTIAAEGAETAVEIMACLPAFGLLSCFAAAADSAAEAAAETVAVETMALEMTAVSGLFFYSAAAAVSAAMAAVDATTAVDANCSWTWKNFFAQ